jgi:hypothetical protein
VASVAATKRRGSAHTARKAAKQRRQKILVGLGLVVFAALLAYEVPHTLKLLKGASPVAISVGATPSAQTSRHKLPRSLRGGGSGGDPFAARVLADGDPRVAAAGGPDPFTASAAPGTASPTASRPLPKQIVIGRPGGNRVATYGWIVILASIPTGNGRGDAERFARGARASVGGLAILNSSHRRPLRGGYWVVYAGPYGTTDAVARRAAGVHAAGYRTAYIRELVTYR